MPFTFLTSNYPTQKDIITTILMINIFPYSNKNTRGLLIQISHYGNIKGKVPPITCHEGIQEVQE